MMSLDMGALVCLFLGHKTAELSPRICLRCGAKVRNEAQFMGRGRALRRKEDPPIPGEPFISMDEAKEICRRMHDTLRESYVRVDIAAGQVLVDQLQQIAELKRKNQQLREAAMPFLGIGILIAAQEKLRKVLDNGDCYCANYETPGKIDPLCPIHGDEK